MDDVDFTDDEISKELADLGYAKIPFERFHQFKKGFENLLLFVFHVHSSSFTYSNFSSIFLIVFKHRI